MKPKEQIIAIAETCGWKWIQTNYEAESGLIGTDSPHSGNIPYQGRNYPSNRHLPMYGKAIPDYLNDLNAMHEAEKTLDFEQSELFEDELCDVTFKDNDGLENPLPCRFSVCHATAAQRAEAFLRTIGKWTTNPNEL